MGPRIKAAAGVALILLQSACDADAENLNSQPDLVTPANAMRVETAVLQPSVASIDIDLPGEIEGSQDAELASALGGFVEQVLVRPGQVVSKGTLIARIDGDLHGAAVSRATARVEQAEIEAARFVTLGDLATGQQILQAETQLKLAKADLAQANAQRKRALVRAPFAGTVADVFVQGGEVAGPGAPVARLVKLDPVVVSLSVPDRDVVALSESMEVTVSANARAGLYRGTISHIAAAASLKTRSFQVKVAVDNPEHELLPGMIAHVQARIALDDKHLIIPQDWIVTRLDGRGVYVVSDDQAAWRPLELGAVVRDQIVVEKGVDVGDRVVVKGHRTIVEGDPLLVSREGFCCSHGRAVWPERE
jgi:membrane fusion protein, multidrug efflux system